MDGYGVRNLKYLAQKVQDKSREAVSGQVNTRYKTSDA